MGLAKDWNAAGGANPPRGAESPSMRDILNPLTGLMTVADVKAMLPAERWTGQRIFTSDTREWRWDAASAAAADGDVAVIVPTVGTGRAILIP